jgi:hypothetical protein
MDSSSRIQTGNQTPHVPHHHFVQRTSLGEDFAERSIVGTDRRSTKPMSDHIYKIVKQQDREMRKAFGELTKTIMPIFKKIK